MSTPRLLVSFRPFPAALRRARALRWAPVGRTDDILKTDASLPPSSEDASRPDGGSGRGEVRSRACGRICCSATGRSARDCASMRWRIGRSAAPIVSGATTYAGSVASPYRETEGMRDGSDAIADWPILNALINTAAGATWVSFHHGGGVGIGYSLHAGMVIVADGTDEAAARLERVLTADPGMGVIRHADLATSAARSGPERGVRIPMTTDGGPMDWGCLPPLWSRSRVRFSADGSRPASAFVAPDRGPSPARFPAGLPVAAGPTVVSRCDRRGAERASAWRSVPRRIQPSNTCARAERTTTDSVHRGWRGVAADVHQIADLIWPPHRVRVQHGVVRVEDA